MCAEELKDKREVVAVSIRGDILADARRTACSSSMSLSRLFEVAVARLLNGPRRKGRPVKVL